MPLKENNSQLLSGYQSHNSFTSFRKNFNETLDTKFSLDILSTDISPLKIERKSSDILDSIKSVIDTLDEEAKTNMKQYIKQQCSKNP